MWWAVETVETVGVNNGRRRRRRRQRPAEGVQRREEAEEEGVGGRNASVLPEAVVKNGRQGDGGESVVRRSKAIRAARRGERSGQKGQKPDKVHNTQRCKTKTLHPAPCKHERAVVCLQRHEDVQRDKANCPGAEVNQGQGEMHDIGLGWAASQKRRVVVRVWRLGTWELGVVKKTPPPILDLDRRELQALSTIARPVQRKPCPGHHQPPLLSAQARPTPAIPPPPSFSPH
jgi:hypothetical protein